MVIAHGVKWPALPSSRQFDRMCVVLVAARNPLNIGAAARAISNFGFSRLRVVNPYQIAFREARSAVGAEKVLADAAEYGSVAEAVADCGLVVGTSALQHRELQHPLRPLEDGARTIREQLAVGRVALLFGSEKRGLRNEDLSHCNWLMRIPTREEHSSMNLGQAVAVCLFEVARTGSSEPPQPAAMAAAGDVERFTNMLLEALRASEYVKPGADVSTEEKVRRLVRRLNLQADDAEVWLGMMRKILRKLRD